MLEDALLRIGTYILKNEALVQMTKQFLNEEIARKAEFYRDIPANAVEMMQKRTRELKFQYKMTLSVFKGSSILNQLKILEEYPHGCRSMCICFSARVQHLESEAGSERLFENNQRYDPLVIFVRKKP